MRTFVLCITLAFATAVSGEELAWPRLNREIAQRFPKSAFITIDELKTNLKKGTALVLVDVQSKEEFKVSHLEGAVHLEKPKEILRRYKTFPGKIVVYCSVGYRSGNIAEQLGQAGMKRVFNLKGSIFEWVNRGYPVFQGKAKTPYVHPYDDHWGQLLNKKFHPRK